jgi:aminopeptidase YwaD
MTRRAHLTLGVLTAIVILGCVGGDISTAGFPDRLRAHAEYLASDSLEGRLIGTPGIAKAADYIMGEFEAMGLEPAFAGSYFQELPIQFGFEVEGQPSLLIGGVALAYPEAYSVLPISGSGHCASKSMFAVPGVLMPATYRSGLAEGFEGLVMIQFVTQEHEAGRWTMKGRDGLLDWMYDVASGAQAQSVSAVIFVSGSPDEPDVPVHTFPIQRHSRRLEIPVFETTYRVMDSVLESHGGSLEDAVFKGIGPSHQTGIAMIPLACEVELTTAERTVHTNNVAGVLMGTARPDQYVVVGGHYDHLGYGDIASSTPWRREVHNGADDNASGVAAVIEIAREVVSAGVPGRSVVFMAFTAEELGALGSEYYCENSPYPLDSTVAMINLDTVGRLEENRLIVFGALSASEFSGMLGRINRHHSLDIIEKQEIYGFSDQNPFYARGIPALHFFTGAYDDYHSPDDDWQNLNYDGLAALVGFVADFTVDIAEVADLTPVIDTGDPAKPATSRGSGAFLGIVPDFAYGGTGVGIKGAVPRSPAERAGLKDGDVILGIDGKPITDLRGLMQFLAGKNPGDTIELQVMRGVSVIPLPATLGVRSEHQSD